MKRNLAPQPLRTHEGATAKRISPELQLRRSVLACLLWEDTFYEDGTSIADRIKGLIPLVPAETVSSLAVEARTRMNLRHVPLLLVREMARIDSHKGLVSNAIQEIILRPDELTEFLALYWDEGRQPLSAQVKKGLAKAFTKFDAYQLAKYDQSHVVKLRDVLFLTHAKPENGQAEIWKQLVDRTLPTPDTWEQNLMKGADKKETFERLISTNKLGDLALLRNLRNMTKAGVSDDLIRDAILHMNTSRILPFRFIAAARYAPQFEPELESALLRTVKAMAPMVGKTILLVDASGSMDNPLSAKSDMRRIDAACGLAMILREMSSHLKVITFSDDTVIVPARHGFALRDAIVHSQEGNSTYLGKAVRSLADLEYDRLIVITDEQSHDGVPEPHHDKAYLINVASDRNGVGYGAWTHIDGFSEAIVRYIQELESVST